MTDLFGTGSVPLTTDSPSPVFTHLEYDLVIFHGHGTMDVQRQMHGRTEHVRSYGGEVFLEPTEVASGGEEGKLYAESLAHTLVLHLLRTSSTLSAIHPLPTRAFTQGQLSKVRDYIDDRLDQH